MQSSFTSLYSWIIIQIQFPTIPSYSEKINKITLSIPYFLKFLKKINWQLIYKEDGSKNILATRDNQFLNIVNYLHKISVFKIKYFISLY